MAAISDREIKAAEAEATQTIQTVLVAAFLLYLCKLHCRFSYAVADAFVAPFAVDFAKKLV